MAGTTAPGSVLNDRQRLFVREYCVDQNATQAAIRAGYSVKAAQPVAARLLSNAIIQSEIRKILDKTEEKIEITAEKVLQELAICGFSDIADLADVDESGQIKAKRFSEMKPGVTRAIQSIEENRVIKENADGSSVTVYDKVKFRTHDKIRSLELLGKHHELFSENVALHVMGKGDAEFRLIVVNPEGEEETKAKPDPSQESGE